MPTVSAPQLFVLGDSISLDYGPYLAEALADAWRYACKGDLALARQDLDVPQGANGGDSGMALRYVQEAVAQGRFAPDVLLLNAGLHDIKCDPYSGALQVSLDAYAQHLRAICALQAAQSWAMIWLRTTHVHDEQHNARPGIRFHRHQRHVEAYNACADAIMQEAGVPVWDLNVVTQGMGVERFRDHVHFIPAVAQAQGAWLAQQLRNYSTAEG